jgi:hypothetical protein
VAFEYFSRLNSFYMSMFCEWIYSRSLFITYPAFSESFLFFSVNAVKWPLKIGC